MDWRVVWAGVLMFVAEGNAADFRVVPSDSTVTLGQPHTLRCSITGEYQKGQMHVYWAWTGPRNQQKFLSVDRTLYPAVDSDKRSRYTITGNLKEGEFNLHMSSVTADDQGEYRCILYDSRGGSKRSSARLIVQESRPPSEGYPKCSITPAKPQPGQYATFSCISAGGVPPATLSWSRLKNTETSVHHNSTTHQTGAYLHRLLTGWDNNVTFTCSSRSSQSVDFGSCSVVPFHIPTHVTILSPQMVTVGDSAEFFCLATSVPSSIRYRWLVGRGRSMKKLTKSKKRFEITNEGASLRILNITQEDNDMPVRCVARNPLDMKGIDEDVVRVTVNRNHFITTVPATKPKPTIPKSRPPPTTNPRPTSAKPRPITTRTVAPDPTTPEWIQTMNVPSAETQSWVSPTTDGQTALEQFPETESPKPRNSKAMIPEVTTKTEEPTRTRETTGPHLPPDPVLQPGPESAGKGSSAGAAVGFTVLILIVLVLLGILIKIKVFDKHEETARKKNLRSTNKPRIDKLDIVVVPNALPSEYCCTGDAERTVTTGDTAPTTTKSGSVKSTKTSRGQSFVHPDFLEQLASTIRSKSHCSSMFKRNSFSWRKRKASAHERPATVNSDNTLAAEAEPTSTVKRYSAFFNAVPPVQSDELPIPSPRKIQKTESVYENTEIGLKLQEDADRNGGESPYENTPCPRRETESCHDPEKRKSEASSLLNLVYADLDWTGFPSRHAEVNDSEEKTEYAAIRTSKAL